MPRDPMTARAMSDVLHGRRGAREGPRLLAGGQGGVALRCHSGRAALPGQGTSPRRETGPKPPSPRAPEACVLARLMIYASRKGTAEEAPELSPRRARLALQ